MVISHNYVDLPEDMGISGSNRWRYVSIFQAIFSGDIPGKMAIEHVPTSFLNGGFSFARLDYWREFDEITSLATEIPIVGLAIRL